MMTTDDHSTMGGHDYELRPDSRRFEVGSYNLAGAYAADASLELILKVGIQAIEDHVLPLAGALNEGIANLGLAAAVPSEGPGQSHVVTFGALDAGGHGFSTDPMITPVSAHLAQARIAHTIRRGQLRFAFHAYNNADDVERAIQCVKEAIKSL
jgi:selenocysteine lyase/cysteine desulfurase